MQGRAWTSVKLGECKHCGASIVGRALDGMRPYRGWEQSRALSNSSQGYVPDVDLWLRSKQCSADAVKARPAAGWEKTKWRCQPGFYLANFAKDSITRFGCLLSAFEHILQTLPKELRRSMAKNPPKSKAELWSRRPLVCGRRGKKARTLVGALPGRVFLKGQLHNRGTGWKKEIKRTSLLCRRPFERKSSSIKFKGRQSRSTGFARDFGSIVAGTKPSGRTVDSNIYLEWRRAKSTHNCGAH